MCNIAVADPAIDVIIVDRHAGDDDDDNEEEFPQRQGDRKKRQQEVNDFIMDFARNNTFGKPLVVAMNVLDPTPGAIAASAQLRKDYARAGVPAYTFPANAAKALASFIKYHEFQAENTDDGR